MSKASKRREPTLEEARAIAMAAMETPNKGRRRDAPLTASSFSIPGHDIDEDSPRRFRRRGKRILQGTVVSDKNEKMVVVKVERRFTNPMMRKTGRMTKKYKAHDEKNTHKVGDVVLIEETRPYLHLWAVIDDTADAE